MPCDPPRAGLRGNRRLAAGAAGFGKTGESAFHKAAFPFCDDRPVDADQLSRLLLNRRPARAGMMPARLTSRWEALGLLIILCGSRSWAEASERTRVGQAMRSS